MTVPGFGSSDNEKRLFLALVLSTLVLLATPYILHRLNPPPPTGAPIETRGEAPAPPENPVPPESPSAVESTEVPLVPLLREDVLGVMREIVLGNEDMELRFSTRGGLISSIRLLTYFEEGEPLELLPQNIPSALPRPLQIATDDSRVQDLLDQAVYEVQGMGPGGAQVLREMQLVYQRGEIRVERTVTLPPSGYVFEVTTRLYRGGERLPVQVSLGSGMGPVRATPENDFASPGVAVGTTETVSRYWEDDLQGGVNLPGSNWLAVDSQYFARALLAEPLGSIQMAIHPVQAEGEDGVTVGLFSARATAPPNGRLRVFFGPKELETLGSAGSNLGELVDFGWFSFLVKPLLFMLKWVYAFVQNYGWAIIILTFLINLVLVPIRYKQIVSMKKMTELQPQLKAIQNRYKGLPRRDPKKQEMNKEVMGLYKQHGVNPLGSCLPLLLQMPFLFAFYRMLWTSVELRGAPFILWIEDLSKYDPYYVTPILMGATMLAQQKMSPSTGDPSQQRMMMMMPVVFTALFLRVSSGLALYFLFSNVFGMLFQVIVQRMSPELSKTPPKVSSNPKKNSRGRKRKSR